jgi:YebC/PmpR family DNA-binding regulatory protein
MAGHSQYKNIMHRKGRQDAAKAKLFSKLAREITVSAKHGTPDPALNARLRLAIQAARAEHMPKDKIERAIKKAAGGDADTYEAIRYEGYGPGGIAVIVEALTDNRNRTGAEVKNVFTRNGGSLAEPGAVAWQFARKGVIILEKSVATEDDLMLAALDAGAEDIQDQGDTWQVTTAATDLHAVRTALDEAGIAVTSADLTMLPTTTVALAEPSAAKSVLRVIDALEEHDDVQNVYANFDIPDDVLQVVYA